MGLYDMAVRTAGYGVPQGYGNTSAYGLPLPPPPAVTPPAAAAPAPISVVLGDLAGSAPLAPSSLDPFLFSSATNLSTDENALVPFDPELFSSITNLSTDENVLVPFDPELLSSPTNLSDETDENVLVPFDPELGTVSVGGGGSALVQSGLEEPERTLAHGGAVMPGLGFRPLRFQEGGAADDGRSVWRAFETFFKNNSKDEVANYIYTHPDLKVVAEQDPALRLMFESVKEWSGFRGYMKRIMEPPSPAPLPGSTDPSVSRPSDRDPEFPGNLGPMTDPSIPRPYAHGGYASRGTVAGELPRYGNMSVREEGETMGELSKRHRDQDWYNRMSGGLGSLGSSRRRGIA